MKYNPAKTGCLIGITSLLAACGGADDSNSPDNLRNSGNSDTSVSLNYDVSAFLAQSISENTLSAADFTADQVLRGELAATTIGGENDGQTETFAWTIYLDEDTFEASSNATLTLEPGNYDFELLMTKGDQQYAGYANQNLVDGENDVAMTIRPIIGDAIDDVTIIDRLAYFKFQYDAAELAALTAPGIGIQVDAGIEQVFNINTQTGLSNTFVNLPVGQHTLALKLYDASVQVGKSVTAQESQYISYGADLTMDIVPLYSEMQFLLTENGGDANLSVTLPAEVVNEVGGVANLTATLALISPKNPLQESALFFVEQPDGSYQADLVLTDLQYDEVTLSMTFTDSSTSDQVASCSNLWTLNNQNQAFNCDITLIRRAVVNGNILAVVGINVENELGQPVAGAVITDAAGNTLAVTGSGTYGTSGYAKLYLRAGTHELTATDVTNGQLNETSVTVAPLEVENLIMVLADPVPSGLTPSDWTFDGVAGYSMTDTALNISVGGGGGGLNATTTIAQDGVVTFDWSITVYSAGQYGDRISYAVNGTQVNLSTAGTASGTGVSIPVSAGDQLMLSTWGTTQSSSYAASFSNYTFVAN